VSEGNAGKIKALLADATQQRLEWLAARPMTPWNDEEAMPGPPHELRRMDLLAPKWGQEFKGSKRKA
jgi:hypothetical protein